jgi:hypothetical protein
MTALRRERIGLVLKPSEPWWMDAGRDELIGRWQRDSSFARNTLRLNRT